MIYSNDLSIYLLQQSQNNICDQNTRSIQDSMHLDDPFGSKFKRVYMDLPNLEVLTKRAIPGDIQVTYAHASVGNKSLKKQSLILPCQDTSRRQPWTQLTLSAPLTEKARIFIYQQWIYSSAPPLATWQNQKKL